MKHFISFFLFLGTCNVTFAQYTIAFKIESFPDSAEVKLNNETIGITPLDIKKTLNFKEYYLYKLEIVKDGFKPYITEFTKENPPKPRTNVFANLERVRYKPDSTLSTFIEVKGFVFEVEQGKKIGTVKKGRSISDLQWEESFVVATEEFNKITEDELMKSGYDIKKQVKLFSDEGVDKEADLIIGANLKDLSINYELDYYSTDMGLLFGPSNVKCKVELEWQIFSRKKREVIYTVVTKGESYCNEKTDKRVSMAIKNAVRDALIVLGYDAGMRKTVTEYKQLIPKVKKDTKQTVIPKITSTKFADYSSMVRSRIQSTVTVLRDDNRHGSGFLISDNGYMITNHHVIDKAKEITVKFENGFEFPAELIAFDEEYDVALLKIKGNGFKGLPVNVDMAGVATEVTSISTPADVKLGQTVTKGIISGKREIEGKIYYQTDVSISPGSSGGPLFNSNGEVIGITTWVIRGGGTEGLNFALPVSVAIEKLGIQFKEIQKTTTTSPYKR